MNKVRWSNQWKNAKQSAKQRKYRFNAPLHIKKKFLSANLLKSLRSKVGKTSLPLRLGDEVVIKRGSFKGSSGEIVKVFIKKSNVHVKGITRKKTDGTEVQVPMDPSNLQIITLNLDDVKRVRGSKKTSALKSNESKETKTTVKAESKVVKKKSVSVKKEKDNSSLKIAKKKTVVKKEPISKTIKN